MQLLLKVIDSISEYSGRAVSYLLLPLILTIVYSVIVRFFFKDIVDWAFEISLFAYGIFVMVGGAYTLKHKSHVRVDILSYYVGRRWSLMLDLLSFAIIIIVCCILVHLGIKAAYVSTMRLERSSLQTPFNPQIWWYRWIIPFSATMIGLQAIVESVRMIKFFNNDKGVGS